MSALTFSPGTAVEVNLGVEDSADIWYPATVIKESSEKSFLVEYRGSNETGPLKVVVDCLHIRPSSPGSVNKTFQLLEKVDAFYNFGWSGGVVTKVLDGGRYIVYFKRTRKEKELSYTDLRVPMVRINGKWVPSSKDATVMSSSPEDTPTNLGDSGKISLPPEISDVAKESEEELRNDKEEQAVPLGKPSRTVNSTRIKRITRNDSTRGRAKKLHTESAPEELQFSPQMCKTKITVLEQLDQPARLEIPVSNMKRNACMEQSENGNQAHVGSATPERKLEIPEEKFDLPTNKRTSSRGRRGRGRGRARRSVFSNPRGSATGVAAKQIPFRESLVSDIGTSVIISLPFNNNGQWNNLQAQSTSKLPVQTTTKAQQEIKQLHDAITDGTTVNTVNDGIPGETVNDGNPEIKRLKDEEITPRRKRGRPVGTVSAAGKVNTNETNEMPTDLGSARRRATREMRAVYESAMHTLRPKGKKQRLGTDVPTQEPQANLKEKAEAVTTNSVRGNIERTSHGFSGNTFDDDRPLSTWFGVAHSPPDHTKSNLGEIASQSGEVEARIDQVKLTVQCNEERSSRNDVSVAQNASQHEDDTRKREGERAVDPTVKSLPFTKTSPIWKLIESMEVFQHIPQNPHFQPLYDTKEHCREGLAIGSMVTFSGLVENISKFKVDDPNSLLEGSMETLSDLERHGFSIEPIRSRLKTLLSIKSRHDQAHTISKEIAEQQKERARIDQEIKEMNKKIAELTEKRRLVLLERQRKDSEISGLHLRFDSMKETLEGACSEFQKLASAHW